MRELDAKHIFRSFDGGVSCAGALLRVENRSALSFETNGARIARGAGLSFSAASFNTATTSMDMQGLNRIECLNTDSLSVTVEAGVSVGRLLEFLKSNGYYLPVMPGYPTITIGGCIAANVHGKNPFRDGTFSNWIEKFTLHHIDIGEIEVVKASSPELFNLTVGGCGLTGTILSVTLRVMPLVNPSVSISTEPISDICDLPEALFRSAEESDYVVSWHDFNQTCGRFGTGFIEIGKMFPVCESLAASAPSQIIFPVKSEHKSDSLVTLRPQTRGRKYPALWQCFAAVAAMNSVYTSVQSMRCGPPRTLTIEQCVFPNRVLRDLYFHGFGRHGLFEHQILIDRIAFSEYVERVRWWLSRNDLPITMASGKAFSGKMCNLHFSKTGICFALDFPRCVQGRQFLNYLDSVVIELGAIPNIFKDSRLPPRVVAETYPDYEEFRKRLLEFDPKRRYSSELSTRLDL